MAYWDSTQHKIIYSKPQEHPYYKQWEILDCGCCNGIEWGGEEPRECRTCEGSGRIFKHIRSGALAKYPGGPFLGRDSR